AHVRAVPAQQACAESFRAYTLPIRASVRNPELIDVQRVAPVNGCTVPPRRNSMSKRVLCLLALLAPAASPILAQTQITTGVIQGTVEDTTGAVVPGADIEAKNVATNQTRTLATGADGRFVF